MPDGDARTEASVVALARSALAHGQAALSARDRISALRWLERAHRLVPSDPNAALTLASVLLASDPAKAAAMFQTIVATHDVRQAWLGLAAARLCLADTAEAAAALTAVLSRHAFHPDATLLAKQIADTTGAAGWCGLRSDGTLEIHPRGQHPVQIVLDQQQIRGQTLPENWEHSKTIDVRSGGTHLLGSPIRITAIRRLTGCVEVCNDGIRGWAWHPNDPATAPILSVTGLDLPIVVRDESVSIAHTGPLARPRTFDIPRKSLLGGAGPVHIRGVDGLDLAGSPLNPFVDEANHVAAAVRIGQVYAAGPGGKMPAAPSTNDNAATLAVVSPALRAGAPVPDMPVGAKARQPAVTIVILVNNCVPACLTRVPPASRVLVVDDGSSDPAVIATLEKLVRQRQISLIRHDRPLGAPASANAGFRAAKGRDVVLLSGDTLVPQGWFERLRAAAYSAADIGTVTPLSNQADSASADQATIDQLDREAERANGKAVIDIPAGAAFCLYIRRDCLDAVGVFRTDLFAQGPDQEIDLCLRARHLGWRSVMLAGLFAGRSTGDATVHMRARNSRIIEQLHPGHNALLKDFATRDLLAEPRRRIDVLRWRTQRRKWTRAVVLITHDAGGGVEQRLRYAVDGYVRAGCRAIVLRPAVTASGETVIAVRDGVSTDPANLIYAMPRELPALLRLLRSAGPETIEVHHLADYPPAIYDLVTRLDIPYDVHVHDYAWFCPRVSLVAASGRYCGEPDLRGCEACIADNGHFLREEIAVAALRKRSAAFLAAARRVTVPSDDAGKRMRRQFAGLTTVTVPHEDDLLTQLPATVPTAGTGRPIVCVVGAIGVHKGYDVLLGCARDAAERDLDLEFVVVGHTTDDARMLATGRVFITGRFEPAEATALIVQQNARLALLPSVWPETWCLALGDVWRAGLAAVAFDFGAPAERIKRTGRGFLLPLGLSPGAINNALLAATRSKAHL